MIVVGQTYRVIYITSLSQNLKNLEICPDRDPREQNLALERRNGPNPSERSFGRSILVHSKATEDKYGISWVYLSSYGYHQPAQKPKNLPDRDPREP